MCKSRYRPITGPAGNARQVGAGPHPGHAGTRPLRSYCYYGLHKASQDDTYTLIGATVPTLVTRQQYFDSALQILSTEGFRGLQVVKLCKVTGMTTGSFYNYFKNLQDFVAQFLSAWRQELTKQLIEAAEIVVEPTERLRKLTELAMTVPHGAEAAIRAWSKVDPMVRAVQQEVDALRIGLIRRAVLNASPDDPDADRLATLGLCIVVGMQQLQSPVDLDDLKWSLDQYVDMVLARASQPAAPAGCDADSPRPRR